MHYDYMVMIGEKTADAEVLKNQTVYTLSKTPVKGTLKGTLIITVDGEPSSLPLSNSCKIEENKVYINWTKGEIPPNTHLVVDYEYVG